MHKHTQLATQIKTEKNTHANKDNKNGLIPFYGNLWWMSISEKQIYMYNMGVSISYVQVCPAY